jgi:membrane protease YdiL (CAAX protease family)
LLSAGRTAAVATIVGAATVFLFLIPRGYFVVGTFLVTSVMVVSTYVTGGYQGLKAPRAKGIAIGLVSALALYGVFLFGNEAIRIFPLSGFGAGDQASIYSLIASPSTPLPVQVGVLIFDSVGYESFFRSVLQERLQPRLGAGAAPAVALFDAGLHLATLNPLWVATTFVADLGWGLTYRYGGRLPSSLTSHLAWDIAIFLVRPIK